jgi:hypothetical protein
MPWSPQNAVVAASLVSMGSLTSGSGITIAVGSSTTLLSLVDVSSYASYDFTIYAYVSGRGAGSPNGYSVKLLWYDDLVSGIPVFQEEWWPFTGINSSSTIAPAAIGTGPMHGRYLSVIVTNPPSSTFTINVQFVNIYGSPRSTPYSDWRQSGVACQPGDTTYTFPVSAPFIGDTIDNTLLALSTTMPISQSLLIPIGMYSGPVGIYFNAEENFNINPALYATTGGAVSGSINATSPLLFQWGIGPAKQYQELLLPRGGSFILLATSSTVAVTFFISVVAQQAA